MHRSYWRRGAIRPLPAAAVSDSVHCSRAVGTLPIRVAIVADKGGVVGVYIMPFLTLDSQPKGSDLIAHIEHVARVAGEDHVGIGSDNGVLPIEITEESRKRNREWANQRIKAGIAAPGEGLDVFPILADYNSVDRYWRLANDLAKRGWSESRLIKLFGGNFLRVYRDAWGG